MYEFRSEEVAYHNIEALFDSEWREYLRDLVIQPTKVTKKQYDHFCPVLCHDEKVFQRLEKLTI